VPLPVGVRSSVCGRWLAGVAGSNPAGGVGCLFRVLCVHGRVGRRARPRTQHDSLHDTKVKPEADTAVIELLMMGGKTSETC
jgi:hypothetical protein